MRLDFEANGHEIAAGDFGNDPCFFQERVVKSSENAF